MDGGQRTEVCKRAYVLTCTRAYVSDLGRLGCYETVG